MNHNAANMETSAPTDKVQVAKLWGITAPYQHHYHQRVMIEQGGPGYDMCNSFNEFLTSTCQSLIQDRFRIVIALVVKFDDGELPPPKASEHPNARLVTVMVEFSDIEYEKGPYLGASNTSDSFQSGPKTKGASTSSYPPRSPKWCLESKQSYVIPVSVKITVTCKIDGIDDAIISECRTSIGSFPIMLFSSACVMTPFPAKYKPTPAEFIQLFQDANLYDPNFLYEYDMGVYIINGLLYAPIVEKDMLRDQLFHNIKITKVNNQQDLLILNSNILCNSPQSNSINLLLTWKQDPETGYMTMTITLKNPPFDTSPFHFFVLFYMFGVVRDGDILNLILEQLPEDMKEIGIYYLSKAIFNQDMANVTYDSFAAMAVNYMNSRVDISKRFHTLISEWVPPHNIMKTYRSRILTQLVGNNRSTTAIEMLRYVAAKTFLEYYNHVIGQDPSVVKTRFSQTRLNFKQSQVLTPNEGNERRVRQTFYQNAHLPIFNSAKYTLTHAKTIADLQTMLMASRLASCIRQQDMTNQNTAAAITRRDIKQRRLLSENKINISIPKNTVGILKTTTQIQKFREFNSESGNMMMRKPLSDAIASIDSVDISESNPGHKQVRTIHTCMSESIDREPLRNTILTFKYICNHPGHYVVDVNGIKVGNVCEPVKLFKQIGEWRRLKTISRFVGRYISIEDREVIVNGVGGMLATLMIVVHNNMQDHIERGVKFNTWIELTPYDIKDFHSGRISLDDLIVAGKLEYITAMEAGCLLICPSLEELWAQRNNPTYQPHYVVPIMTMFAFSTLGLISMENLPVTRGTYYTSQATHTVEFDCFVNTKRKKNGCLISGCSSVESNLIQNIAPIKITYMLTMYTTMPQAQEDGSVINSHVIDFQMRCCLYDTITHILKITSQSIVTRHMARELGIEHLLPPYITEEGLPEIGTELRKNMVMYYVHNSALRPTGPNKNNTRTPPVLYIHNQVAYVTGAFIINKSSQTIQITIETFTDMYESCSNKINDEAGSKSVISACLPPYKLPYTQNGVSPSIIMSMATHVNRNIYINNQLIAYWAAFEECKNLESQPFDACTYTPVPPRIQAEWGMDEYAMCRLNNQFGTLQTNRTQTLFVGMSAIQKWGVVDEYGTSTASIDTNTGQAQPGGRRNNGGFRLGPMEVGQLGNVGAAGVLRETMMDRRAINVCKECQIPVIMYDRHNGQCRMCGGNDLIQIQTSHTAQVIKHRLAGANINSHWVLDSKADYEYLAESVVHNK